MTTSKSERWIKAGYNLLATESADTVNVERIAKMLKANKSGFYHYFRTRESYFKDLLSYHTHMAEAVAGEIALCKAIDPDLLHVVVKFKSFFLVESQLLIKSKSFHIEEDADVAGRIITRELISLWKNLGGAPYDSIVMQDYLDIIRHFFYVRIDVNSMNYDSLHALTNKTKHVLERLIRDKDTDPQEPSCSPASQLEAPS